MLSETFGMLRRTSTALNLNFRFFYTNYLQKYKQTQYSMRSEEIRKTPNNNELKLL